jgi:very-short-patch-repair endonuclease
MKVEQSPTRSLLRAAEAQRGVISASQIREFELPIRTARRLVGTGQLVDLYPNVYIVGGNKPDWKAKLLGATTWGGPTAVASHRSGARMHGLPIKSEVIEITITQRVRAPAGIKVHYGSIDPLDVRRIEGIAVTSVARTLLTLGSVVPRVLLEQLMDDAIMSEKVNIDSLVDVLLREGRRGIRGAKAFRRLLDQRIALPETIRSHFERKMNRIFRDENLPPAVPQHKVVIEGRTLYPDFSYPELKIAIECDSHQFHLSRQARESDIERQNLMTLAGWLVLPFTWLMVTTQPKMVAANIRTAIASRSS